MTDSHIYFNLVDLNMFSVGQLACSVQLQQWWCGMFQSLELAVGKDKLFTTRVLRFLLKRETSPYFLGKTSCLSPPKKKKKAFRGLERGGKLEAFEIDHIS